MGQAGGMGRASRRLRASASREAQGTPWDAIVRTRQSQAPGISLARKRRSIGAARKSGEARRRQVKRAGLAAEPLAPQQPLTSPERLRDHHVIGAVAAALDQTSTDARHQDGRERKQCSDHDMLEIHIELGQDRRPVITSSDYEPTDGHHVCRHMRANRRILCSRGFAARERAALAVVEREDMHSSLTRTGPPGRRRIEFGSPRESGRSPFWVPAKRACDQGPS